MDLASGEETVIPADYDPEEQERDLERRLRQLLAIGQAEAETRRQKAAAAARLPFPHAAPRPGQKIMMEAVRQAVEAGENLIAEAPTGSGKTAASLHPALAHGLAAGRQVFFLTSKTLQQTMAVSALRAMNPRRRLPHLADSRQGKNVRQRPRALSRRFLPLRQGLSGKNGAVENPGAACAGTISILTPTPFLRRRKRSEVCPFEVQLELAGRADAIVADYNYVFEPGVALRRLEPEDEPVLLVDEAHNLPDRARKIFSPELLEESFRAVAGQPAAAKRRIVRRAFPDPRPASSRCWPKPPPPPCPAPIAEMDPPAEALRALWQEWEPDFIRYLAWKREARLALPDDPIVDIHFAWQRFMAVLNLFGPGFTCVVEQRPAGARLAIVCLDPARPLAPVFARRRLDHASLRHAFAGGGHPPHARIGGGADARDFAAAAVPAREPEDPDLAAGAAPPSPSAARNFASHRPVDCGDGRCPARQRPGSFSQLSIPGKSGRRCCRPRARGVVVQRPNFSEAERRRIFQELAAPPPQGILLLAVLGGMYAEGVDYPGELLSAVFIVSPALPQVSFERELLRRYFEETEQAGFEYAYLQPGMTRVIQAAGRLIRSETDRGVIALLCQRFLQEPYASHLPRDWY